MSMIADTSPSVSLRRLKLSTYASNELIYTFHGLKLISGVKLLMKVVSNQVHWNSELIPIN